MKISKSVLQAVTIELTGQYTDDERAEASEDFMQQTLDIIDLVGLPTPIAAGIQDGKFCYFAFRSYEQSSEVFEYLSNLHDGIAKLLGLAGFSQAKLPLEQNDDLPF